MTLHGTGSSHGDSQRMAALIAGLALLGPAVLAGFAQFCELQALVVPTDAAATIFKVAPVASGA